MKHLGLFEGIGGFSLAARWAGWETVAWCEWNEFGQKVLRYHFPEAEGHGDITKTDFKKYANRIDIITGGFPCQPYSLAGKRKGKEDERHLWPEMLRAIREVKPRWVVGENVFGIVNWNGGLVFDEVQADLENQGYQVQAYVLPACAVNAPHRRDRVWFVAKNSNSNGWGGLERESKTCERKQRNIGTGNNERVRANNDKAGVFTNPNSNGQQWSNSDNEINTSERGEHALHDAFENVMHPNGSSKQWEYFGSERKRKFNRPKSRNAINGFENFPTQSPVCGGDDGLPRKLDGITFPKWRTESIKAYGNAIVPQVALQIFKAINEYENLNK